MCWERNVLCIPIYRESWLCYKWNGVQPKWVIVEYSVSRLETSELSFLNWMWPSGKENGGGVLVLNVEIVVWRSGGDFFVGWKGSDGK